MLKTTVLAILSVSFTRTGALARRYHGAYIKGIARKSYTPEAEDSIAMVLIAVFYYLKSIPSVYRSVTMDLAQPGFSYQLSREA